MGDDDRWIRLLAPRALGPGPLVPVVRIATGLILVVVGALVLADHGSVADDLDRWALPAPSATAWVAGAVLLVGGALIAVGLAARLAGAVVAFVLVVQLATGGVVDRDLEHLGLGSLLLIGAAVVTWAGAGAWSVDEALLARRGPSGPGAAGGPGAGTGGDPGGPAGTMPAP